MAPKIERIVENFELGEAPHWDEEKQILYFVDIFKKTIDSYDPKSKKHSQVQFDESVSFIVPVEGQQNQFLISLGAKVVKITWDGVSDSVSSKEVLAELENPGILQFNDAKADPEGRLWLGTLALGKDKSFINGLSSFYSFSNGKLIKQLDGVDISNGLAWNPDLNKFYYIDSGKGTVDQFDYDPKNGTISNRKPIFTLSKHNLPGVGDGMTIDADGNLWVAVFGSYKVVKIDPRKPETLLDSVELPAKQITSVAFGGPNYEDLYVTTGAIRYGGDEPKPPIHGAVYRVTNIGARGLRADRVRV